MIADDYRAIADRYAELRRNRADDKTVAACAAKFDNLKSFVGFPKIPDRDEWLGPQ